MLDEREGFLTFVKTLIEAEGKKTQLFDVSVGNGGNVSSLNADVGCERLAESGGMSLRQLREVFARERERVGAERFSDSNRKMRL
jgi:hypothetical protein